MLKKEIVKIRDLGGAVLARDKMEKSIIINASPEKVWEMLAWDRFPEWMKGWEKVEYTIDLYTPEDKYRVGTTAYVALRRREMDLEIIESIKNEKFAFNFEGIRLNAIMTCLLEPVEKGTKFTYIMDYEIHLGLLGRFFAGSRIKSLESDIGRSLETLKNILEK